MQTHGANLPLNLPARFAAFRERVFFWPGFGFARASLGTSSKTVDLLPITNDISKHYPFIIFNLYPIDPTCGLVHYDVLVIRLTIIYLTIETPNISSHERVPMTPPKCLGYENGTKCSIFYSIFVPVVLHMVVRSAWESFGNFRPSIT